MRIEIPEGSHPVMHVWGSMVPGIGPAAVAFSQAVYDHSTLELTTFEAARLRVAQLNGCVFCQDWRTERGGEVVPTGFDEWVAAWQTTDELGTRERLAAEYATRYVTDHHGLDDEFWDQMHESFTDAEIVELSMCLGSWLAFGRLNRVLGLDTACVLPGH